MTNQIKLLRPYQVEAAKAILQSVEDHKGLTFTVEIARQGGKNELSAQLEVLLLTRNMIESKNLIKCSPTFKPQTVVSMQRLKETLNTEGFGGIWKSEMGYIIHLVEAKAIFLSADNSSNVVGNTAHLLIEVDEAQDVSEEKYYKEFKPMGSTTNVTSVLYGTTWDDSTLLEKMKQINLELEKKDGIRRHFQYDCYEVAKYNADYLAHIETHRNQLGEDHPFFMTQYLLKPIHGGGSFLSLQQRIQMQGEHSRLHRAEAGKIYVAGIDLAGEAESIEDDFLKNIRPHQDSTVVTIAEVDFAFNASSQVAGLTAYSPEIKIVEHYCWTGHRHASLYPTIVDILKNVWHCRKISVDATGMGQPVASFLRQALGSKVVPFVFTAPAKTELGFNLLATINAGRLKMYTADNSEEYKEFCFETERAKSHFRQNRTMNFYVDQAEGHDDYLMSLALVVEAAREYTPREARGN
jgi:hypothetical protein